VRPWPGFFCCYCGLASRKSSTIGTMIGIRSISVAWVVLGKMASLDAERGRSEMSGTKVIMTKIVECGFIASHSWFLARGGVKWWPRTLAISS